MLISTLKYNKSFAILGGVVINNCVIHPRMKRETDNIRIARLSGTIIINRP